MINQWCQVLDENEAKAAYDAVMSAEISNGRFVNEFEKRLSDFLGRKYVLCVPNGSSALLLALMSIGIGPGDEVIVPDITFIATGHAPKLLGATVVLCDVCEDKPLIDIDKINDLITPKTKAIIPVHLNGRGVDIRKLKNKIKNKDIYIIDDSCQAFGSKGLDGYLGKNGDIACYSFAVTKIMTTGQGGFVATDDDKLYEKMCQLKTQGMSSVFESNCYQYAGFNLKYSGILANIGMVQLDKMNQKIDYCKHIYGMYSNAFEDDNALKMIMTRDEEVVFTPEVMVDDPVELRRYLKSKGIETRPAGLCLHRAGYFESRMNYSNAEKFEKHILFLPGGPNQPEKNIQETINVILERNIKQGSRNESN